MIHAIVIPFDDRDAIPKYAEEHGISKYTRMYIPSRGKNHPHKFLIVAEEIKYPAYTILGGYYFSKLKDLKKFKKAAFPHWDNPSLTWKLINGGYILFGANINKPIGC